MYLQSKTINQNIKFTISENFIHGQMWKRRYLRKNNSVLYVKATLKLQIPLKFWHLLDYMYLQDKVFKIHSVFRH